MAVFRRRRENSGAPFSFLNFLTKVARSSTTA
eukprot:COSAG06_NODE_15734_length_1049_cov_2.236842_2_plen_31_part_01